MLLTMMSETVWKDFQRIFENKQGGSDEIGGSNGLKIENSNEMTDSSGDTSSPVSGLSIETLTKLKHGAWLGSYFSKGIRGLCWRIMLGKLSYHGLSSWKQEIPAQIVKYENMKETILPDINRFHDEHDPLSEGSDSGEWAQYYKDLELISFIKGDLERLYMNGVADEYFKTEKRQAMLLNILFIWAHLHPQTSYRQGMHEIVAPFLYVLEQEREEWTQNSESFNVPLPTQSLYLELCEFSKILCGHEDSKEAAIEAQTYWLFDRIMIDLEPLYSPVTGADEQPAIVHFCTKIQEHMLRGLDPPLCRHLEENFIQAQLYGMRWSRLLLGREFELTETSLLRIWDYMFACIFDAELSLRIGSHGKGSTHAILGNQLPKEKQTRMPLQSSENRPQPSDPLSGALFEDQEKSHLLHEGRDSDDTDDDDIVWTTSSAVIKSSSRFGPSSPLLDALSDFMLAMLLHIRDQLIQGDSSSTMFLLMRYPQLKDVTPIIDLADMIRRGVLDTGAHIGATMSRNEVFDLPSFDPVNDKYRVDTFAALTPQSTSRAHGVDSMRKPSWLLGLGSHSTQKENRTSRTQSGTSPTHSSLGYLEGGLRRVSMTLSAVGSAVFSSSDDHQNSKNPSIVTPSKNERAQQQQLSPVLSPTSPSSSTVGGVHDSSFSDMTFTPPHPSTQLKILSSEKANHFSHHPQPQPGDFSARCHGVSEKLHHLATSLEQWTMLVLNSSGSSMSNIAEDKDNPMTIQRVKDHLVPDMVSRLRYLSGVLDGTIDLKDYDEIFGSDSLGSSNVLPDLTLAERNDDSVLSATSTLTPSRPVNSSRLISRAYDSDDSTNFQPSPAPQPTSQKDDVLLSDWKGSGRSSDPDHTLDDFEPGTNISPIQILYSKPSNQKLKYSRQDT